MRVLILEDNEDRQQIFRRRYPDAVIVATAPACIEELSEPFDLAYLDHDLGRFKLPDSNQEDCGRVVVMHILEYMPEHLRETKFVIHSANMYRARIMVEDLQRAGYEAEQRSFINLLPELESPG